MAASQEWRQCGDFRVGLAGGGSRCAIPAVDRSAGARQRLQRQGQKQGLHHPRRCFSHPRSQHETNPRRWWRALFPKRGTQPVRPRVEPLSHRSKRRKNPPFRERQRSLRWRRVQLAQRLPRLGKRGQPDRVAKPAAQGIAANRRYSRPIRAGRRGLEVLVHRRGPARLDRRQSRQNRLAWRIVVAPAPPRGHRRRWDFLPAGPAGL